MASIKKPAHVLDVGNCNPDHGMISQMLRQHFHVEIDRVMFVNDALKRMRERAYDLILVNRLIFDDGSEGMELLHRAKADPALEKYPIMMISNYAEAQERAVQAGGISGFGKAAIGSPGAILLLSKYLPSME